MDEHPTGPVPLPAGTEVRAASAKGMTLVSPQPLPRGSVLECDLLMGARPLSLMARVVDCRPAGPPSKHVVEVEFLVMAQVDRDSLADFLQAVGPSALRVREHREE